MKKICTETDGCSNICKYFEGLFKVLLSIAFRDSDEYPGQLLIFDVSVSC